MKTLRFPVLVIGIIYIIAGCTVAMSGPERPKAKSPFAPEYFAVLTSTLDGKNIKEIIRDPTREINHAKVSNDHKWIAFMRFNTIGRSGVAMESNGYDNTEIVVCRIDGSELQVLTPAKKGVINGNPYWTSDDKGILYISTDTPDRKPGLFIIDVKTKKKRRLPVPKGCFPTDPHMVGDLLVFPAWTKKFPTRSIYTMDIDGKNLKRITSPPRGSEGENDPKLSLDKSKVAIFRNIKKGEWHLVVVDLKTSEENDLSPPNVVEGVAEWSPDGKLLVFWHFNPEKFKKSKTLAQLYTIRPDGSERRKIDLPPEFWYTHVAFFPGTTSTKDAKIIFSAKKFPSIFFQKRRLFQ